jgi:hypothetical protein
MYSYFKVTLQLPYRAHQKPYLHQRVLVLSALDKRHCLSRLREEGRLHAGQFLLSIQPIGQEVSRCS